MTAGASVPVNIDPAISEVEVVDDDGNFVAQDHTFDKLISFYPIYTVIVVGFESTSVSVAEDIGLVELCVRIITDASLLPVHTEFNFSLDLISTPGLAGMTTC